MRHARGLTMIELLVAATVSLAVFGAGFLALNSATRSRDEFERRIRAAETARQLFDMIERDVKLAYRGPGDPHNLTMQYSSTYMPNYTVYTGPDGADALQIFTRRDTRREPDEHLFVRYFLGDDGLLCRHEALFNPTATPAQTSPAVEAVDPGETEHALYQGVSSFRVFMLIWDPSNQQFRGLSVQPPNPPYNAYTHSPAGEPFTHICVVLTLKQDVGKQESVHSFARLIPIPESFR